MAALSEEWRGIVARAKHVAAAEGQDLVSGWESALASLAFETAGLKAQGRWRSGPRTLLAAMGLEGRGLTLVAGLAWMWY
ncbi:hypothetical protein Pflav_008860 [Phytohabitans flavus]|uniref:Uncharacterized protein n=1 Tax=Phytohabitans flavus TaxID=1076124 RepID=A0A6F8XKY3_9ACTN|nr:hypothetical protein Pflav_008860 [Phytohabitans flavus]